MSRLPESIPSTAPWCVLLATGVREKRAYAVDANTVKLVWFDRWAVGREFVACGIVTAAELAKLPALLECARPAKPLPAAVRERELEADCIVFEHLDDVYKHPRLPVVATAWAGQVVVAIRGADGCWVDTRGYAVDGTKFDRLPVVERPR